MHPSGPPRTVLPAEKRDARDRTSAGPRCAVRAIVGRWSPRFVAANPRSLNGWAALGGLGRDEIERYAAYRVGYHRGLDALRANGWRGSGYVRWIDETNRRLPPLSPRPAADGARRSVRPTRPSESPSSCSSSIPAAFPPANDDRSARCGALRRCQSAHGSREGDASGGRRGDGAACGRRARHRRMFARHRRRW